jgi:iron complex transport system substrate-binding protein
MKFRTIPLFAALILIVASIAPLAAQETTECEAGYRLFDHEYLATDPVCIPENPQRILALEMSALEATLLSGKELVGTASWLHDEVPVLLPEFASALEGIPNTGYPANLEAALESAPDLILAVDGDIDMEEGGEIAPIVMPKPGIEHDWRESMEFWSAVLGTEDLFAEMVANYDARIAEFKDALTGDAPMVSIVAASSYGASLWFPDTAPGVVVEEAGLARPETQSLTGADTLERYGEERWVTLSDERLDLADADVIFLFTYAPQATLPSPSRKIRHSPPSRRIRSGKACRLHRRGASTS